MNEAPPAAGVPPPQHFRAPLAERLVAGVKVPDWSAPSLAPADINRRIKARNRRPVLLLIAAALTILARFADRN